MAKKKSSSAADDLIKSLMDEVNSEEENSAKENPFLAQEKNDKSVTLNFPVGFKPEPEEKYNGPSSSDQYQSPNEIYGSSSKIKPLAVVPDLADEKTVPLKSPHDSDYEMKALPREPQPERVMSPRASSGPSVLTHLDASLVQAENLKYAQQRILDLEQEVDRLRQENEEVSAAADTVKTRTEELNVRISQLERERDDHAENANNEMMILRGQLQFKETELTKTLQKVDELETRIKNDFRKIRVRERELENRLELLRAEKTTLVRSKDDSILTLKSKVDQLQHEIDNYRDKCLELNKTLDSQKEQFKRTVRALKMALTNLEVKSDELPVKKAE